MTQEEEKILEQRIKMLENKVSPRLPGVEILWFLIWGFVGVFIILVLIGDTVCICITDYTKRQQITIVIQA